MAIGSTILLMELDARVRSRLEEISEILETVGRLESIGKNTRSSMEAVRRWNATPEHRWLPAAEQGWARVQQVLDVADRDIERARGNVAYIKDLIDGGGPDAEWPDR